MTASFGHRIWEHGTRELGLTTLYTSPFDAKIIYLLRFLRLWANGACSLILALYLSSLGVSDAKIGLFISLTLLGNVIVAVLMTFAADGLGRRRMLAIGAVLMLGSGLVFATSGEYWVLLPAAALGILSPRWVSVLWEGPNSLTPSDVVVMKLEPFDPSRSPFLLISHISMFAAISSHGMV